MVTGALKLGCVGVGVGLRFFLSHIHIYDVINKPKTSFVFTAEDDEDRGNEINGNANQMNDSNLPNSNIDSFRNITNKNIHEPHVETLDTNEHIEINLSFSRT